MALTNKRPRRKVSGGRYIDYRKKKVKEGRRVPALTKIGNKVKRVAKILGGGKKEMLFSVDIANVYNPKTKKMQKVKIKSVLENQANRHFVRRNILTKGAVIETELGKAKVTSRPGQEGAVNAVLM